MFSLRHQMRNLVLWVGFLWLQLIYFSPSNDNGPTSLGIDFVGRDLNPEAAEPRSAQTKRQPGDALFNNIDVYYKEFQVQYDSNAHCIGRDLIDADLNRNYSWMFRSCQFQNLCLNTESKEFILLDAHSVSPHPDQDLAIGSINPRWSGRGFNKGFHKVKWFPRWVPASSIQGGYYELPENVVMVPFHSMAAHNVGHLLWDDFYPIFTLLKLFGYIPLSSLSKLYQPLLLRWSSEKKLYATCDIRPNKGQLCNANFDRFLPLMGIDHNTFSTVKNAKLRPKSQHLKSVYVCSKQAVAGIGMLMDHGLRDHGWVLQDPESRVDLVPHNIGRGGIFRDFRNFMVQNMGFPLQLEPTRPRKITFSTHSSRGFERSLSFENQSAVIARALQGSNTIVAVQSLTMKQLSLEDQIQVALDSAVFVTVCGGGAVTATFLPPGSTLIVYYAEDGGFDFWEYNYTYNLPKYNYKPQPARLDWDLLTNAAHLKVHWLPMKSMESQDDLKVLEQLVLHDLDAMGLLN